MNKREIRQRIELVVEKAIAKYDRERGDVHPRIKRAAEVKYLPAPAPPASPVAGPSGATPAPATSGASPARPGVEHEEDGLHSIQSPIVGTFYDAPSPGAPPFVKPGDTVENGQVLCIIEAMKLMNEIESDVAGEV